MNASSVEKHCFVMLNVKLEVKVRFKRIFFRLELLYTAFTLSTTTKMACFTRSLSKS